MQNATPHFKWREFFCPKTKMCIVNDLTLHHIERLEELRVLLDRPLRVNSAYRSPEHNKAVGGAVRSMHLQFATDIAPVGEITMDKLDEIAQAAERIEFSGIGRYNSFVHLDCRSYVGRKPARWDKRR